MELQKLSSEVSRGGFIDIGMEVTGDTFFHRGQILGNLAEKFCYVRKDTKKKGLQWESRLIREKNTLFVNVRASIRRRSEGILSPRWPTMILRLGKRLQLNLRKSDFESSGCRYRGALTQIHHLCIDFFKASTTKSIDHKRTKLTLKYGSREL